MATNSYFTIATINLDCTAQNKTTAQKKMDKFRADLKAQADITRYIAGKLRRHGLTCSRFAIEPVIEKD